MTTKTYKTTCAGIAKLKTTVYPLPPYTLITKVYTSTFAGPHDIEWISAITTAIPARTSILTLTGVDGRESLSTETVEITAATVTGPDSTVTQDVLNTRFQTKTSSRGDLTVVSGTRDGDEPEPTGEGENKGADIHGGERKEAPPKEGRAGRTTVPCLPEILGWVVVVVPLSLVL